MSRGAEISKEVFDKVKKLAETNLFTNKQIADMNGLSQSTVYRIKASKTLDEMRAVSRATFTLQTDKNGREMSPVERRAAAKKAYEEAQREIENEKNDVDKFDNPGLKMDIITEKLDVIIELLKQVRIAQTEPKGIPMPGPKAPY